MGQCTIHPRQTRHSRSCTGLDSPCPLQHSRELNLHCLHLCVEVRKLKMLSLSGAELKQNCTFVSRT